MLRRRLPPASSPRSQKKESTDHRSNQLCVIQPLRHHSAENKSTSALRMNFCQANASQFLGSATFRWPLLDDFRQSVIKYFECV